MPWIFNGSSSRFCSGVFTTRKKAEKWITENKPSGLLTLYPIDESAYDWAIRQGFFTPSKESEKTPEFKQKFTSASFEHHHYENGELE